MSALQAKIGLACSIANIDPDRLNEWIAAGDYPCAPATVPGRARVFKDREIVGLLIFKRLMALGMSAAGAGRVACGVAACLPGHQYRYVVYTDGEAELATAAELAPLTSNSNASFTIVFDTEALLGKVQREIERASQIVGDE
jgi:hypothetical protein